MRNIDDEPCGKPNLPGAAHQGPDLAGSGRHSGGLCLLRSACWMFLANPLAFAVALTCGWFLGQAYLGIAHTRAEGITWGLADVARYVGLNLALVFVGGLAIGHLVLMCIAGWKSRRE